MYIVNKLNKCRYTHLPSLITMISADHNVLSDIATSKMYCSIPRYLDKLYSELGLCNHGWVKNLYQVDKPYAQSKIADALSKVMISHIYAYKSRFIVTSEEFISNYNYVITKMNKTGTNYSYCKDKYHTHDTLLSIRTDTNRGCLVEISLATNKFVYYDVQLSEGIILMSKNTTIQMDDPKFKTLIDSAFSMISCVRMDYLFNPWKDTKLTYEEYIRMLKSIKLASGSSRLRISEGAFSDEDYETYANLEPYQYSLTLTSYTVKDLLTHLTEQLLSDTDCEVHDIYWIYNRILSDELMSTKLENTSK